MVNMNWPVLPGKNSEYHYLRQKNVSLNVTKYNFTKISPKSLLFEFFLVFNTEITEIKNKKTLNHSFIVFSLLSFFPKSLNI